VTSNDAKEPFKSLPPSFNDFIREPVSEDLAREGRNVDASRLPFEDITERFKVRVTTSHEGVA
jgi:hypothetical protein